MSRTKFGLGFSLPYFPLLAGGGAAPFDPTDPKWGGLFINDSEQEVYGPFNAPSLDWNPATGEWDSAFGPTPTYTNGATGEPGTYFDENGDVVQAAVNEPRITTDPVTGVTGATCEPEKEQLVGQTDFSDWAVSPSLIAVPGAGYRGQPSYVLTNSAIAQNFDTPVPALAGSNYCYGFWARELTPGAIGTTFIRTQGVTGAARTAIPITSEWQYFYVSLSGGSLNTVNFGMRLDTIGQQVEISMPQVELGTAPSSFIPNDTGSPVTRAADIIQIPDVSSIVSGAASTPLTVYMEFVPHSLSDTTSRAILSGHRGGWSDRIAYINSNETRARSYDTEDGPNTGFYPDFFLQEGVIQRLALTTTGTNDDLSLSCQGLENTGEAYSGGFSNITELNIGCTDTQDRQLNGIITRITFWKEPISQL